MKRSLFVSALLAASALAGAALAQTPAISVSVGHDLARKTEKIGHRDVDQQLADLQRLVTRAVADRPEYQGSEIHLVLTDLQPNRPTFQQLGDRPGLSATGSISIGGAAIEGEVVTADGTRRPVQFDWYSHNIRDVRGHAVWTDAGIAFNRFARSLASGRL